MSRAFGMIATSVWGSVKFRALPDDTSRLGYLFLHTNTHGNSIGAYRMPVEYIVGDMNQDIKEANRIMDAIVSAGLVEYDKAESSVRILNWFRHNPINSPKHLAGAVTRFLEVPRKSFFLPEVAVEIIISAHAKARELGLRGRSQISSARSERSKTSGQINLDSAATMLQSLIEMIECLDSDQQNIMFDGLNKHPSRLVKPIADDLDIPVSGTGYRGIDRGMHRGMDTPIATETDTDTHTHTHTHTETETQKQPDFDQSIAKDIADLKAKAEGNG